MIAKAQNKVFMTILDRTILWGKNKERVTSNHFTEGIPGTTGGSGISRSTLMRSISGLEAKSCVNVIRQKSGNTYTLNLDWTAEMLKRPKQEKDAETGLKTSKRRAKIAQQDGQKLPTGRAKIAHYKNNTLKEDTSKKANPEGSLAETIENATKENRQRRSSRVAAVKKKPTIKQTVADLQTVWRSAIAQNDLYAVHSMVPWTGKEIGMLKLFMKSVEIKGGSLADYLEWVVDQWHTIGAAKFAFSKVDLNEAPPTLPLK